MKSYQEVVAPFSGIVTAQNGQPRRLGDRRQGTFDPRALPPRPDGHVAGRSPRTSRKRSRPTSRSGRRPWCPGAKTRRTFAGTVTRTADALDLSTHTLLTEVQVLNPDEALRPGMYLQVRFVFERRAPSVLIPAAALTTRAAGARLAVLDDQNRVHHRTVQLGRDFGMRDGDTRGDSPRRDRGSSIPGTIYPKGQRWIRSPHK